MSDVLQLSVKSSERCDSEMICGVIETICQHAQETEEQGSSVLHEESACV